MTGSILIVDALATNRILLKVRLGGGFYSVAHACDGAAALEAATHGAPDLLLVSLPLRDMPLEILHRRLRELCGSQPPAIVAMLGPRDPQSPPEAHQAARLAALRAGATLVLDSDCENADLQARLRALLRQRHQESDLHLQTDTAEALGFEEEPMGFDGQARISVLASEPGAGQALKRRIAPFCRHALSAGAHALPEPRGAKPDVILLHVGARCTEADMATLAALRAAPHTRQARLIAVVDPLKAHLCGALLDMGAHDALSTGCDAREIALRTEMQLARKRQNDALRKRLETGLRAAVTDPLTGLYNRRYALTFLNRALKGSLNEQGSIAIMLADLDHFKQVNDRHGHAAGDAVLTHVSQLMSAALPPDGLVARIGGEEFLLALPGTTPEAAAAFADNLRCAVRGAHVPLAGGAGMIRVTMSIGVTLVTHRAGSEWPDVERLIGEADRALYDSKSCGRDKVTFCMRSAA